MDSGDLRGRIEGLSAAKRALLDRWRAEPAAHRGGAVVAGTPAERILLDIWRSVLRVDHVAEDDSFLALGGDSITGLQVAAKASAAGLRLTARQVLEAESLRRLAATATHTGAAEPVADEPTGRVTLTPIQRWFFEQRIPESHYWDQAVVVESRGRVDAAALSSALTLLVAHHDALRSRFTEAGGTWTQTVAETAPPVPLRVVEEEVGAGGGPAWRAALAAAQREIDLGSGPLLSATLFRGGEQGPDRLLLAIHHLVVDGVSLRILVEDLERAYGALVAGRTPALPAKTTSLRRWSQVLDRYATSPEVTGQLDRWLAIPRAAAAALPVDRPAGTNLVAGCATASARLPDEVTHRLVHQVPRRSGTQVRHVLIAALLVAWGRHTGRLALQLDLEAHGREPIDPAVDVSRTVGWFTAIHPVVFDIRSADPLAVLGAVRERLDGIPDNGIGYGLLRYRGGPAGEALARRPQSQLSFNYLGRFESQAGPDAVFGAPVEVPTVLQSERAARRYLIEVVATITGPTLVLDWHYAGASYRRQTIETLARAHAAALGELVDALLDAAPYALARLTPAQLAGIRRRLDEGGAP